MKKALDYIGTIASGVAASLIYRAIDKRLSEREERQAEAKRDGKHFRKPKR